MALTPRLRAVAGSGKGRMSIAHPGYIGGGSNTWSAVHRLDAAHLFCPALEKAPAGSALHAIDDESSWGTTFGRHSEGWPKSGHR